MFLAGHMDLSSPLWASGEGGEVGWCWEGGGGKGWAGDRVPSISPLTGNGQKGREKKKSFSEKNEWPLCQGDVGLRSQHDKGATEPPAADDRFKQAQESRWRGALSTANEAKLDSGDGSENDIHEVRQERGVAVLGRPTAAAVSRKEGLFVPADKKTALTETVWGQIEIWMYVWGNDHLIRREWGNS